MPHLVAVGQLKIHFGGRSPRARRNSFQGARVACVHAGSQKARMLDAYLSNGALTDLQMGERLGLPESRISARRSALLERSLVTYLDDIAGPFGAPNSRWTLTPYGREIARALQQAQIGVA